MRLEEEIKRLGLWYRFIEKEETTHTADASEATGIPLNRITKNLISLTSEGETVLLIIPGDRRVDLKKAAAALGVSNVKLYPFSETHLLSGYPPGGTPSIGLKERMRTVLDAELSSVETFFCGGGTRDRLLELRTEDVMRVSGALVADITR
jgi:Cys-tRNA(Pro)/Cys-tRNA(Cys) deacylase